MNQKIYEHDTEISPAIRYCQPCISINLQKFVKNGKIFWTTMPG